MSRPSDRASHQQHSYSQHARICRYCDSHKKANETTSRSPNSSGNKDHARRRRGPSEVRNRILVTSPEDDAALLKATAIIQKFQRRRAETASDSPTSCLRSPASPSKKNAGLEKRVNFEKESSKNRNDYSSAKHQNYNRNSSRASGKTERSYPSLGYGESRQVKKTRQSSTPSSIVSSETPRNRRTSRYYKEERSYRVKSPNKGKNSLIDFEAQRKRYIEKRDIKTIETVSTGSSCRRKFTASLDRRVNTADSIECSSYELRDRPYQRRSERGRYQALPSESSRDSAEARLLDQLGRLSLSSSSCCSPITSSTGEALESNSRVPRVVKPRDGRQRAALRRMLVYPPEGQRGEPLVLRKRWSNIECHVAGDPEQGFRYKVYYLQKFVSDKWYPDVKTGGPFCSVEDGDLSTDYG